MPLILLPFYIVLCAIGAYGYKLSKSKYQRQQIKGKFFCICSCICIMLIAVLSPFFISNEEPDFDDDYTHSQWKTLGTLLKKEKSGGTVLFVTGPMNANEKKAFKKYRGDTLITWYNCRRHIYFQIHLNIVESILIVFQNSKYSPAIIFVDK